MRCDMCQRQNKRVIAINYSALAPLRLLRQLRGFPTLHSDSDSAHWTHI